MPGEHDELGLTEWHGVDDLTSDELIEFMFALQTRIEQREEGVTPEDVVPLPELITEADLTNLLMLDGAHYSNDWSPDAEVG